MKLKPARISAAQMPPRLAQSAFELFAERGFANVNLDQIAARAGVTKGSLYWHYRSKHELLLAACNLYYRQWHAAVHAALAPLPDPLERLRAALAFSVASCVLDRQNRMFTISLFMLMQEDALARAGWAQFYAAVREFYIGLVAAAQAAGRLPPGAARRRVDLMLEAMEGLKLRAGFEPQAAQPAEQQVIIDSLLGIFLPQAAQALPAGMGKTQTPRSKRTNQR
jgi:AcrR family transcriptional regulator